MMCCGKNIGRMVKCLIMTLNRPPKSQVERERESELNDNNNFILFPAASKVANERNSA